MSAADLSLLKTPTADTLRPIEILWFDAITFDPAEGGYLVKGLLDAGSFALLYGPPACGKSFLATDIALHVACGWEWFGRKVKPGAVIYIAAEGQHGFKKRIEAFRRVRMAEDAEPVPFALVPTALDLLDPTADTPRLIAEIEASKPADVPIALIVVDTVSRSLAGGDENGPELGNFIANCDRIRQATGAALLAVHHSGKNAANGARGWNGLPAAADTVLEVEEVGSIRQATIRKQKEGRVGDAITFDLEVVELGADADGDPVTSCVVRAVDAAAVATRNVSLPDSARRALEWLRELVDSAGELPPASNHIPAGVRAVRVDLWREYCARGQITETDTPEAKRKAFKRAAEALQKAGAIGSWDGWVWLA